jgi:hypothetical protein
VALSALLPFLHDVAGGHGHGDIEQSLSLGDMGASQHHHSKGVIMGRIRAVIIKA